MVQAGGNKIPREPEEEEVKRPQTEVGAQQNSAELMPGTEFLEDIWDTDESKR